ncbi:MAG TPA: hypothetical protein VGI86_06255 [Acidimicrobiia bacterium]
MSNTLVGTDVTDATRLAGAGERPYFGTSVSVVLDDFFELEPLPTTAMMIATTTTITTAPPIHHTRDAPRAGAG